MGDHVRLDRVALGGEVQVRHRPAGEGPKPGLGVGGPAGAARIRAEGEHLLAEAAVDGDIGLFPDEAGADDEVGLAGEDRGGDGHDLLGVVLAVGVDHDDGVGRVLPRTLESGHQGGGLAAVLGHHDDVGPGQAGDLGGAVLRTIVDDDHRFCTPPRPEDDAADDEFLVVRRDDDHDRIRAGFLP